MPEAHAGKLPRCDVCKNNQVEQGALVFAPPHNDFGQVRKWHVCRLCYMARFAPILSGVDQQRPQDAIKVDDLIANLTDGVRQFKEIAKKWGIIE
jgi:hypothetical protein